jgi:nitrogen regulatory protein P-II 1
MSGTLIAFILKKETEMKRIEAIIRPTKVGKVCTALEEVGNYRPMISQIEGRGGQEGIKYQLRGKTYRADLLTRTRVEVMVEDKEADRIVRAIRDAAFTGEIGDGEIYIYGMTDAVQIRTGVSGEAAR